MEKNVSYFRNKINILVKPFRHYALQIFKLTDVVWYTINLDQNNTCGYACVINLLIEYVFQYSFENTQQ